MLAVHRAHAPRLEAARPCDLFDLLAECLVAALPVHQRYPLRRNRRQTASSVGVDAAGTSRAFRAERGRIAKELQGPWVRDDQPIDLGQLQDAVAFVREQRVDGSRDEIVDPASTLQLGGLAQRLVGRRVDDARELAQPSRIEIEVGADRAQPFDDAADEREVARIRRLARQRHTRLDEPAYATPHLLRQPRAVRSEPASSGP